MPSSDWEKLRVICVLEVGSTIGDGCGTTCGAPGFRVTAGSGADREELDLA